MDSGLGNFCNCKSLATTEALDETDFETEDQAACPSQEPRHISARHQVHVLGQVLYFTHDAAEN